MTRLLLALVLTLACIAPVAADDSNDARIAYESGDFGTALRLWRPLAEQGDVAAQFSLGLMYAYGQGVPRDYAEAMKWYRRAADAGDANSQFNLGVMYNAGQGLPQDFAEAMKWYRRAAEQGAAMAQFNLGLLYAKGEGVARDFVLAHKWLNLAAATHPPGEKRDLAVSNRDLAASKMTPEQITKAQKLAREFKPRPER